MDSSATTVTTATVVADSTDLKKICRLCLKKDAGVVDIFDKKKSLVLRILTCTAIEIESSDALSNYVCNDCRNDLERSYYFRKRSQNSNNKLKKHMRLINAGKISKLFKRPSENADGNNENDDDDDDDDDDLELKDSIEFLNDLEKNRKEKFENEIKERLKEFELLKKLEIDKEIEIIKIKNENDLIERITKLKNEHEKKMKCLKQEYEKEFNQRLEKAKEELRKQERSQIIENIKDFLNTTISTAMEETTENFKKPMKILNTEVNENERLTIEASSSANGKQQKRKFTKTLEKLSNNDKKKTSEISQAIPKSSISSSSSSTSTSSSVAPRNNELLKVEPEPPRKLLKFSSNDNDDEDEDEQQNNDNDTREDDGVGNNLENVQNDNNNGDCIEFIINELEMNDENQDPENPENSNSNQSNDVESRSYKIYENIEIINEAVTESDTTTAIESTNDDNIDDGHNTKDRTLKKFETVDVADGFSKFEMVDEEFGLINENDLRLKSNNDYDSVTLNSQKAIESLVQETLAQDNLKFLGNNVKFNLQKISDKITEVKVTTEDGNVIVLEVQSQNNNANSEIAHQKQQLSRPVTNLSSINKKIKSIKKEPGTITDNNTVHIITSTTSTTTTNIDINCDDENYHQGSDDGEDDFYGEEDDEDYEYDDYDVTADKEHNTKKFSAYPNLKITSVVGSGDGKKPSAIDDTIRTFRCELCPQAFSREALLIRHKTVHAKSRVYACDYCEKWFACRSSLKRHIRVHTGEKPFSCDECGRSFIQKEILKRHMLVHTGERPHKCPHCDKSFAQKPLLRQHINQKHTENPVVELHECHLCSKTFMHASGLSRHLITHTGICFNCNQCGRSFSDRSALKRHEIGVHSRPMKK